MSRRNFQGVDTAGEAEFWKVTVRTVQRWISGGRDLRDRIAHARWLIGQPKVKAETRMVAQDVLRREQIGVATESPGAKNADNPSPSEPDEEAMRFFAEQADGEPDLETQLRYYSLRWRRAVENRNRGDESYYQERIIKIQNAIRQHKLMEDKLGVQSGEILPRADVQRFLYAFTFWLMRSTQQSLMELCPELVDQAFEEQVYHHLQPYLLSARFLSPLTKAVTAPSGVSLPEWFVTTLRDAVDDVLEDGDAAWDAFAERALKDL